MNRNDKEFIANKIRTQYVERESTELDELRKLDRKVKKPVNVFAFVFGSIGAIVMGSGMSLVMTDIGEITGIENALMWGIIIGVIGLLGVVINYPVYKKMLSSRKKKFASRIIDMTDKIMG